MTLKKKLPIGISDFKEIVERGEYYYVDKSLIIKDLLDHGAKSMLFTRPRRFGKTLNLSMLRYFFEKTDENTADLFTNLAISRQGSTYMNYQGKHPVIYLTFKDVKSRQWSKSLEQLKRVISEEYRRHKYLLTNADLDRYEEREFQEIIGLTATETAYENSIRKLSALLTNYHGEKTLSLPTDKSGGF
ncbi:hypothetical protein CEN49_27565 [Fischerella thermalis CCMEE 5273]|nr:hypothetical protein CEN49_27565 [Fischerella thermalis CCMEE 5273]